MSFFLVLFLGIVIVGIEGRRYLVKKVLLVLFLVFRDEGKFSVSFYLVFYNYMRYFFGIFLVLRCIRCGEEILVLNFLVVVGFIN